MTGPVLFVCTGNICRSAYAARRWNEAIGVAGLTDVPRALSAGTQARPGDTPTVDMVDAASSTGTTLDGHSAQPLEAESVEAASVVLGATRSHRGESIRLHPRANRYAFSVIEFARLGGSLDVDDLPDDFASLGADRFPAFVRATASRRGFLPPERPADDDVADPHGRGPAAHAAAVKELDAAVTTIVEALCRAYGA